MIHCPICLKKPGKVWRSILSSSGDVTAKPDPWPSVSQFIYSRLFGQSKATSNKYRIAAPAKAFSMAEASSRGGNTEEAK
jgi:hypothetical protein